MARNGIAATCRPPPPANPARCTNVRAIKCADLRARRTSGRSAWHRSGPGVGRPGGEVATGESGLTRTRDRARPQVCLGDQDRGVVVVRLWGHLQRERHEPPPSPGRMVHEVPAARGQRGPLLLDGLDRNAEAGQPSQDRGAGRPVTHEHAVDVVGLRPRVHDVRELAERRDPAGDDASGPVDRDPAPVPARVDGEHRHRNVTSTGPIVYVSTSATARTSTGACTVAIWSRVSRKIAGSIRRSGGLEARAKAGEMMPRRLAAIAADVPRSRRPASICARPPRPSIRRVAIVCPSLKTRRLGKTMTEARTGRPRTVFSDAIIRTTIGWPRSAISRATASAVRPG